VFPPLQVPQNLKLTIQNTEEKLYCGGNVILGQTVQPTSTSGDWNEFVIPLNVFGCTNPSLAQVLSLPLRIEEIIPMTVIRMMCLHLVCYWRGVGEGGG